VLRTSWPVLLVIGALALFVWPWVNQRANDLKERFERRSDLSRVAPGQFQTSSDGKRVFFIDRDSEDGRTGRNVFILSTTPSAESVTSAKTGRIELDGEDRFLVLDRGQRNEENERALSRVDEKPPRATPSADLLRNPTPRHLGELTWRLGLLLGATNLLLLAIPLSAANPRRASNWNLLFALLTFVVYYNAINLSQAWVAAGRLEMGAALALFHGGAFLIAIALLWWREQGNRRLLSLRKAAA
jgi:lipopolysaccharide export system permease protein